MKLNYASLFDDSNIYEKYSLTPNIIEHAEITEDSLNKINVKTIIIKPLIPEFTPGVRRITENSQKLWYLGHIDIFDTEGNNIITSSEYPDYIISIELVDYNSSNYIKKSSIPQNLTDYPSVTNLLRKDPENQITYNGKNLDKKRFVMCLNYPSIIKINIPDDINVSAIVLTPFLEGNKWEQIMDLKIELYDFNWSLHTNHDPNLHFYPTPIYSMVTPFYENNSSYQGPGKSYGPYSIALSNKKNNKLLSILINLLNNKHYKELKDTSSSYRIIINEVTSKDKVLEEEDIKFNKNSWEENFKIFSDGKNQLNDDQAKIMIFWFKTLAWLKRPRSDSYNLQNHPEFNEVKINDLYNHINFNFNKIYNDNLPLSHKLPNNYDHQNYIFKNLKLKAYSDFMKSYYKSEFVNENESLLAKILKNENINLISNLKTNTAEYCKFLNIFQTDFDPCSIKRKDDKILVQEEESLVKISNSLYNFFNKKKPIIKESVNKISQSSSNNVVTIKTFEDIFDLYDLDKDSKLNKYEAKLFLATITKKPIKLITDYLLKTNFLGINLQDIDKNSFVEAYKKSNLSSDDQYKILKPLINIYKDDKYKIADVKKSWENVFDELFDLDKNGLLSSYEGKLFLATVTDKKVNKITDNDLKSNFLKVNLQNISKSNFVSACEKLTNAKGEKQSSTEAYNLLSSKIKDYHDPEIQKNTDITKTWEDIFEELYDFSSNDGKLDIYEAKLFLATSYKKPIQNINDSLLTSNYMNVSLKNIDKKSFVNAIKKLKDANGEKLNPSVIFREFKSKVTKYHDENLRKQMLSKTWEDIFNLYDLNKDGKLDKYEAKLVLATVTQKPVNNIDDSMLKSNFLKVNLENINKNNFVNACKKLNTSASKSYDIFSFRIKKYHNLLHQKDILKQSVTKVAKNTKVNVDKFKIDINIFYIILVLFIPIAMILATIHGKSNN